MRTRAHPAEAAPSPGPAPGGVARRDLLTLAALAPGVAMLGAVRPEGVVITPSGWILLESDLR